MAEKVIFQKHSNALVSNEEVMGEKELETEKAGRRTTGMQMEAPRCCTLSTRNMT